MTVMPKHHVVRHGVGLDVVVFERNAEDYLCYYEDERTSARECAEFDAHAY